jgi:putative endonuclease
MTNRLLERIKQHREGLFPGFTGQYRIHRLVYFETYRDVKAAISREKQIKGLSRVKKITLIETRNPTWEDLAAEWFAPYPNKADSSLRRPTASQERSGKKKRRPSPLGMTVGW